MEKVNNKHVGKMIIIKQNIIELNVLTLNISMLTNHA